MAIIFSTLRQDTTSTEEATMMDLFFLALTVVFFLLALAYVRGCEKLQ